MGLKQYKPNTSSQRGLVLLIKVNFIRESLLKLLLKVYQKMGGRNNLVT